MGLRRREFLAGAGGVAAAAGAGAVVGSAVVGSVVVGSVVVGSAPAAAAENPVVLENQRAGDSSWKLTNPASDDLLKLGAYCRQDSVSAGGRVDVCVLLPTTTEVIATVFRLGFYGGAQARRMATLSSRSVAPTPALLVDQATGETTSDAAPSFTIDVGADWLSGVYVIRLVTAAGVDCHATFTVRDARLADVIFSQPVLTYAAYTNTPQPFGKSLYDGQSGGSTTSRGTQRATEISLDRPYRNSGSGDLFYWDHDLITWLEREGYDVTYVTNVDIHREPSTLLRTRIIAVGGHDEYWTQSVMDAYLAARGAGVHIAYFGANGAYWRVRLGAGPDGRANRKVMCWKYADGEDSSVPTVLFKDTDSTMQSLWGVDFMDFNDFIAGPYAPIVPTSADHWFWAGSGVENDQPLQAAPIMGYEVDRRNFSIDLPANSEYTLLASSPFEGDEFGRNWAHTTLYRAPGGAWVFAAGTTSWAWGLMRTGFKDQALHRATQNLLRRMLADSVKPAPPAPKTVASATSLAAILAADDYVESDGDILRLYRAFFDRQPDFSGAKYWLLQARAGRSITNISAFFAISPEFNKTYGPLDDRAFLDVLYRNVLDRPADNDGSRFWLGEMEAGMTRARVVLLFADSPEFRRKYPF